MLNEVITKHTGSMVALRLFSRCWLFCWHFVSKTWKQFSKKKLERDERPFIILLFYLKRIHIQVHVPSDIVNQKKPTFSTNYETSINSFHLILLNPPDFAFNLILIFTSFLLLLFFLKTILIIIKIDDNNCLRENLNLLTLFFSSFSLALLHKVRMKLCKYRYV